MQKRFILLTIFGSLAIVFSAAAFLRAATPAPAGSGYQVIKTIPVGGEGGWVYVYVDSAARIIHAARTSCFSARAPTPYLAAFPNPNELTVHALPPPLAVA